MELKVTARCKVGYWLLKITARCKVGYWLLLVMERNLSAHHARVCTNMLGLNPKVHSSSSFFLPSSNSACTMGQVICFSKQRSSNTWVVAHSVGLSLKARRLSVPWVQPPKGSRDIQTIPSNQSLNSCLEMMLCLGSNKTLWGNARPKIESWFLISRCFGRESFLHWDWSGGGICLCV